MPTDGLTQEMKGEREKLRDAARRVVREYVHGSPDSLALAMVWLRVLSFESNEEVE